MGRGVIEMIFLFYFAPMMISWLFLITYFNVIDQDKNKLKVLFISVIPVINIIGAITAILVFIDGECDQ